MAPIISCDIHEAALPVLVCEHIFQFLQVRVKNHTDFSPSEADFSKVCIRRIIFHKRLGFFSVFSYCDLCAQKFKLSRGNVSDIGFIFLNFNSFKIFEKTTKGVCGRCFYKELFNKEVTNEMSFPFINEEKEILD